MGSDMTIGRRYTRAFWGILGVSVLLGGVAPSAAQPAAPREIVVVDDQSYAPFSFRDAQGQPRGFTVDLWRLWSEKTGIAVDFRPMEWNDALAAVRDGKADVVGGLFRTPQREAWFDFTEPLFEFPTSIFFHSQIQGVKDLADTSGFTVGVVSGDSSEEYLLAQQPKIVLRRYPDMEQLVKAAAAGDIKVFVADTPVALHYLARTPGGENFRQSTHPVFDNRQYAAVRRGNTQLLAVLRSGFSQISAKEVDHILEVWGGIPVANTIPWREIGLVLATLLILGAVILGWNTHLRMRIRHATRDLAIRNTELEAAQGVLSQSESRYRVLFADSPDPYMILADGVVIDCNRAAETLLLTPRQQLIGTRPEKFSPEFQPDGTPSALSAQSYLAQASHREHQVFEWMHQRSDGIPVHVEICMSSMLLDSRPVLFSALRDITARKQAEAALRDSENKLRSLFAAMEDVIIVTNAEGRYIEIAPTASSLLYRPPVELLGKTVDEVLPPELATRFKQTIRSVLETGSRQSLDYAMEIAGRLVWFAASISPFTPGRVLWVARDITERKRAEEALRQSEDRFRSIVEQSPFSTMVFAPNGDAVHVNDAHLRLWGTTRDMVAGYNVYRDLQAEALGLWPIFRRAFTGEQIMVPPLEYDLRSSLGGGVKKIVQSQFYPVRDGNGNVILLIVIHQDVTERERAEVEKRRLQEQLHQAVKMEAVGRLAGGVAHDFNNMLGVILGHTELAMENLAPGNPLHTDLLEIQRAAERSADLTRQLLGFARKQTVSPKLLNINDTIDGMLKMLRRLIGEDIELVWLPGQITAPIKIDPSQLDQVLANLCINARDAIGNTGTVTIRTEAASLDEAFCARHAGSTPGAYIVLTISDTGSGIDSETLPRLFEPFFTTKETGKGTGLGLATVYGIVTQNKGFIEVQSEIGCGTTFTIHLPAQTEQAPAPQKRPQAAPPVQGNETILLVEDEPAILKLGSRILGNFGYTVLAASTPRDAIELAQGHSQKIHLLMTDVIMPEMNGRELAARIAAIHPDIRLLFMSGYTADVIAHHGVLGEGMHFVQKPFNMRELSAKVREALDVEQG